MNPFELNLNVIPQFAFNLPIPDTSCHIVNLEMPSCDNVFDLVGLCELDIAWSPFCKLLDDKGT